MSHSAASRPVGRNADVWIDYTWQFLCHAYQTVVELGHGIKTNTIPWATCFTFGIAWCLMILGHVDVWMSRKLGLAWAYPTRATPYYVYLFFAITGGFWIWAMSQVRHRVKLARRLKQVFLDSGLKTVTGRLPTFISNTPIDYYTFKLRLGTVGLPKSHFDKAKEYIESGLHVSIDQFKDNRHSGTIDIVYSHFEMPRLVHLYEIDSLPGYCFVVGETRGGRIIESLREVPHLLIAGASGGGKSTFLRQFISTLYLNNEHCQFTLIDLKGGLEFQLFEDLNRAKVMPDLSSALSALEGFEEKLHGRMALLRANGVKDIDAYFSIPKDRRKIVSEFSSSSLDRHIIIIDEAAEMLMAGDRASGSDVQRARRILGQISRQGRAVGIHLVVATQRPDTKAIDSQVKANLQGTLCFAMPNDMSSITVLGNGRATDLPGDAKGRAIWKKNMDMKELQTPLLTVEAAKELFASIREKEKAKRGTDQSVVSSVEESGGAASASGSSTSSNRGAMDSSSAAIKPAESL